MPLRSAFFLLLAGGLALTPSVAAPQSGARSLPARAIRRDIPLTDMIRRAFADGTRDSTGRPGARYWQLWVDYTIHARLDPQASRVSGRQTVIVHNTSRRPMTSLWVRLDQNLYAPNVPRSRTVPEITEGMAITALAVDGAPVALHPEPRPRGSWRSTPEPEIRLAAYATGETNAEITLPSPVPPGQAVTVTAEWTFRVPEAGARDGIRMGRWADSLYQIAQWYPRVAVFDDLREGGWDTEPYLGGSEFYNNFGRFDVTIDVPAGWIVGATGVLQNPEEVLTAEEQARLADVLASDSLRVILPAGVAGPGRSTAPGDRLQWHFVADTVNDFAWATSDRFVWEATRARIPGRGAIPIHILYPPGSAPDFEDVGPTARHALEFYSDLWMPYAFPQLTIADGPDRGMEYPMFIMSARGAADHEVGHEWWPMMVSNNETWYGFMDEGFNVYMNRLSRAHRDGVQPELDGLGQSYGRASGDEREAPLMWNANYGGPNYRFQAYDKAPLMLSMLGAVVGDTAVWRAMSDYASAWRFRHPSPWDYAFFMNHALGRDLGWFWYSWLFTTESVDGSIQDVRTSGGRTAVTVRQDGGMPSPVVLEVRFAAAGPAIRPMANATMVDSVTAIVRWPEDVWFAGHRTFVADLEFGPRTIERIVFDPQCRFPDRAPADNVWPRRTEPLEVPAASGFRDPVCRY